MARTQLLALGFDRRSIEYRLKVGRLHLLHRGVYAVGHRPPSPLAKAMAAVLACGPDAALSHQSAAALWRILPRWSVLAHVTASGERRHSGIHVHRSKQSDATTHYGIPVTTPARTLVDLADAPRPSAHPSRQRGPGPSARHRGRADHPLHPISRTAHLIVRFLKRHRLPFPELNQHIAGHEVDAVYRDERLVIELDSRQFHTTPRAFEQDRDRDADLLNAGFSTLRITDHRLKHDATREAQRLEAILRSRTLGASAV